MVVNLFHVVKSKSGNFKVGDGNYYKIPITIKLEWLIDWFWFYIVFWGAIFKSFYDGRDMVKVTLEECAHAYFYVLGRCSILCSPPYFLNPWDVQVYWVEINTLASFLKSIYFIQEVKRNRLPILCKQQTGGILHCFLHMVSHSDGHLLQNPADKCMPHFRPARDMSHSHDNRRCGRHMILLKSNSSKLFTNVDILKSV